MPINQGQVFAPFTPRQKEVGVKYDSGKLGMSAALFTTSTTQALQTLALGGWLMIRSRRSLVAVLAAWRSSLGAGFFGAAASALWLTALALAPAAPVRAIGVIEMPLSAIAGRRLFAERLSLRQLVLGLVVTAGVALTALA